MTTLNTDHTTAVVARAAEAEVLGDDPVATQLLVDHDATGGRLSTNRTCLAPGASGPPPHYHATSSEMFFVLDGVLEVLAGDRVVTLTRGDMVVVPPFMPHAWRATADAPADVLIVFSPGLERFAYLRLTDQVLGGEASVDEILATSDRFDNHWVDSPAWSA